MNEILQQRIEEVAENHEQYYNVGEEHGYLYTHKGDIKEAVIYGATFALQNQWTSVKETLPVLVDKKSGQSEVVLAMTDYGSLFTAYYDYSNEHWYYNNYDGFDNQVYRKVTHWMPIPELKEK